MWNMSCLMKRVLAVFLIVGIGVSPLYAAAMKGMERTAPATSMAAMVTTCRAITPNPLPTNFLLHLLFLGTFFFRAQSLPVHGGLPVIVLSGHASGRRLRRRHPPS